MLTSKGVSCEVRDNYTVLLTAIKYPALAYDKIVIEQQGVFRIDHKTKARSLVCRGRPTTANPSVATTATATTPVGHALPPTIAEQRRKQGEDRPSLDTMLAMHAAWADDNNEQLAEAYRQMDSKDSAIKRQGSQTSSKLSEQLLCSIVSYLNQYLMCTQRGRQSLVVQAITTADKSDATGAKMSSVVDIWSVTEFHNFHANWRRRRDEHVHTTRRTVRSQGNLLTSGKRLRGPGPGLLRRRVPRVDSYCADAFAGERLEQAIGDDQGVSAVGAHFHIVAIVEQDIRAAASTPGYLAGPLNIGEDAVWTDRLPVVPHNVPLHRLHPQVGSGAENGRTARPVGRAEVADGRTRGVFDRFAAAVQLLTDHALRLEVQPRMGLSMVAEEMARGVDAANDLRTLAHELADEEKRRARIVPRAVRATH